MSTRPTGPCAGRFIEVGGNSQHGTPRLFSQLTWRWQQLDFYKDLKSRAKAQRRDPDSIIILPGFSPIIAGTEAEAKQIAKELNELTDVEVGRKRLMGRFGGYDFRIYHLTDHLHKMIFPIRRRFRLLAVALRLS